MPLRDILLMPMLPDSSMFYASSFAAYALSPRECFSPRHGHVRQLFSPLIGFAMFYYWCHQRHLRCLAIHAIRHIRRLPLLTFSMMRAAAADLANAESHMPDYSALRASGARQLMLPPWCCQRYIEYRRRYFAICCRYFFAASPPFMLMLISSMIIFMPLRYFHYLASIDVLRQLDDCRLRLRLLHWCCHTILRLITIDAGIRFYYADIDVSMPLLALRLILPRLYFRLRWFSLMLAAMPWWRWCCHYYATPFRRHAGYYAVMLRSYALMPLMPLFSCCRWVCCRYAYYAIISLSCLH